MDTTETLAEHLKLQTFDVQSLSFREKYFLRFTDADKFCCTSLR